MNISKELLIHSATAKTVTGMNADRQPTYGTPIELSGIWIDLENGSNNGSYGKTETDSGTFYFDCVNSSPSGFVPSVGMVLVFNEHNYSIKSVKACYGFNGVEHYQCGVV